MQRKPSLPIALWLGLLLVIPLVAVFLLSLAAATTIGAGVLALYYLLRPTSKPLPRQRQRQRQPDIDAIELDPSDYHRLPENPSDGAR